MTDTVRADLMSALRRHWPGAPGQKAQRYVGKFTDCTQVGSKLSARVLGNPGTYTVSIELDGDLVDSACSCYIGKDGYCHHCAALAATFLREPHVFTVIDQKSVEDIGETKTLAALKEHLAQITLDDLSKQLRAKGITQKAFAESIGMNPQHFTAVKSSERRNRHFNELGAMKLACMWALDHIDE